MTAINMTPKITALLTRAKNLARERAANWTAANTGKSFPIDHAKEERHFAEREAILAEIAKCENFTPHDT